MSTLLVCVCCGEVPILDPSTGTLVQTENFVQRGMRLASGTEHVMAFCRSCVDRITPTDWPRIMQHNREQFEEAWALNNVPDALRARHRAEMATWEILGWAHDLTAAQARALVAARQ